jgi:hypothetical protein
MRNIAEKGVEKIRTEILYSVTFFSKIAPCLYEIMWTNILDPNRPLIAIWRMRSLCRISRATHTHVQDTLYLLFFHCNIGCTNAAQCYGMSTFNVLFISEFVNNGQCAPQFTTVEHSGVATLCNSCHVMNLVDSLVDPCSAAIDTV